VVITGPEAAGKSTLVQAVAAHFGVPWGAEYARIYAEAIARPLAATDVEPIARGQTDLEATAEQAALARGARLVVLDTDLVSTVVYSHHYYGMCPEWIVQAARERRGDLYLLLEPDLPWVPDGIRDRPRRRQAMRDEFRAWLERFDARVAEIRGFGPERFEKAVAAIEQGLPDLI
jgi:NadR type nicotinamide-nucleotide adenylyltransferase